MVNVIRGSSAKPVSSQRLAKYFEERTDIEGRLYIGYPNSSNSARRISN
jgi:hypothetical protein